MSAVNWKIQERQFLTKWRLPSYRRKGWTWRQRERSLLTNWKRG